MGFWETFVAEALAGIAVAIAAVFLAWRFTHRYAAKRETERARRERDFAAAADLYQVLGKFFTAWKVWDFHSRLPGKGANPERLSELVAEAALPRAAASRSSHAWCWSTTSPETRKRLCGAFALPLRNYA